MGQPLIVLGDKTDHGGTVLSGDPAATINGKPIARLGDMVDCPLCKGTFPILPGTPQAHYKGRPVVLHGYRTGCGATLIASQASVRSDEEGAVASLMPSPIPAPPSARYA